MKLENRLTIEAPPSIVWQVTTAIEQWPEWTPTVESVEPLDNTPFGPGYSALLKQPGLGKVKWTVTELVPGSSFTWQALALGMSMQATHQLTANGPNTENLLIMELSGLLARVAQPFLCPKIKQALQQENAGLKRRCEEIKTVSHAGLS